MRQYLILSFKFFIRTISHTKICNSAKCIAWVWSLKHQPKCKQPQIWNRKLDSVHFHTDTTLVLVVFTYVERGMLIKYIFSLILGLDHEKWSKIGQQLVLAVIKLIDHLFVLSYASKKNIYQLWVKSVERCYPYRARVHVHKITHSRYIVWGSFKL